MKRFSTIFIVASWIIYFATNKGTVGAAFLIASGAYALCEIVLGKEQDDER